MAQGQGIIPPNRGPHLFSPLTPGSDRTSPTPSAGKIGGNPSAGEFRREKQAGKVHAGPARASVLAILRAFLDGFFTAEIVAAWSVEDGVRKCG